MGINVIASAFYTILGLNDFFNNSQLTLIKMTSGILFLLQNTLFVACAYSFVKITHEADKPSKDATVIDVVIYAASLASSPKSIDALLDPLRMLTAAHETHRPWSEQETVKATAIYCALEDHLVKDDELRDFTRGEIRRIIAHRFTADVYQPFHLE